MMKSVNQSPFVFIAKLYNDLFVNVKHIIFTGRSLFMIQ